MLSQHLEKKKGRDTFPLAFLVKNYVNRKLGGISESAQLVEADVWVIFQCPIGKEIDQFLYENCMTVGKYYERSRKYPPIL